MYDPVLDNVYKLFRKGMGYVHDKHIYKFKDYSECVFDTQIQSKYWLIGHLQNPKKRGNREIKSVDILASWYGIVIVPLLFNAFGKIKINLYDIDEYTIDIAKHIFKDEYDNLVTAHCKDVVFDELDLKGDVVINCSCEHMFDMSHIVHQYPDKLFVLQSNNNRNIKWLHINCAKDQGELADQADLRKIHFGESKEMYGQKRIMIFGEHRNAA